MRQAFRFSLVILMTTLLTTGCRKREALLPDNLVNFETTAQGISEQEQGISLKIRLDRAVNSAVPVTIKLAEQGTQYGTDYTTIPAAVSGEVQVTIPSGNNEAVITINKTSGALFDGDEKIIFDIYSSGSPVIIGAIRQLTLTFAELVAQAPSLTINGGGAAYPNKVFIDLSASRQSPVQRTTWDLGFYTGTDFRVILNSSSAMMAKQLNKNDLDAVTAADTIGLTNELNFSQTMPVPAQMAYIDHPDGNLSKTAIAAITATDSDNKVYILNRGKGVGNPAPDRGWKKIRIIRNTTGGYTLQHADIAATGYSTIDIPKDAAYFFKYISFENGLVNVEPESKKWDMAWTYFSNATNFGSGEVPYLFQDIILQNRNVQSVRVMNSTRAFADFAETDITGLSFSSLQHAIGSDWRSGGGPGTQPAVRTDRYYIIKDGDNNYYKLRFTALTQTGERGYPAFEAVLVKRGG